jgi:uncharacterized protein YydD (DUF2326 family)
MVLMEKYIVNKENPLTVDEPLEELSLRYERLSLLAETTNEIDLTDKKACLRLNSRENTETVERWVIRRQFARLDASNSQGLTFK